MAEKNTLNGVLLHYFNYLVLQLFRKLGELKRKFSNLIGPYQWHHMRFQFIPAIPYQINVHCSDQVSPRFPLSSLHTRRIWVCKFHTFYVKSHCVQCSKIRPSQNNSASELFKSSCFLKFLSNFLGALKTFVIFLL